MVKLPRDTEGTWSGSANGIRKENVAEEYVTADSFNIAQEKTNSLPEELIKLQRVGFPTSPNLLRPSYIPTQQGQIRGISAFQSRLLR